MRHACLLFAASLIVLTAGCSNEPESTAGPGTAGDPAPASVDRTATPAEVATAFMQAMTAGDEAAFNQLLTDKARESIESMGDDGKFTGEDFESYTIGEESVQGEEASVAVSAVQEGETQNVNLKMRRERGNWRVYAMGVVLAPGSEMTMNLEQMGEMLQQMTTALGDAIGQGFEQAMGDWTAGGSEEEIAHAAERFDALAPVAAADYEAAWKVSKNYRGTTAADAIGELAASMGLSVDPGDHAEALAEHVGFDTRGMSKLQAVAEIAAATGLQPILPDLNDYGVLQSMAEGLGEAIVGLVGGDNSPITIKGGEAEAALNEARAEIDRLKNAPSNAIQFESREDGRRIVFAGPFELRISEVQENPPHATGSLTVVASAYGLPQSVVVTMDETDQCIQLDAVEDAKGRPLIDMDMTYFGGGQPAGTAFVDVANRDLRNLLRDVETIETISGAVTVSRPAEVVELDFTSLESGASVEKAGFRFTVSKADDQNTSFKVAVPAGWEGDLSAKFQPYKADGSPMGINFSDVMIWNDEGGNANLSTPERPARVRIKLIPKVEKHTYDFELGPVALAHYAEMPDKLEELSFAGHDAPISLAFVKVTEPDDSFAKVLIKLENHSNKAPQSAFVDFIYRDAAGNEIDSFPHTLTGKFGSDGWAPLVTPGETVESEQTAFQMPANAASIDFVVKSLEFLDGTTWQAEN